MMMSIVVVVVVVTHKDCELGHRFNVLMGISTVPHTNTHIHIDTHAYA